MYTLLCYLQCWLSTTNAGPNMHSQGRLFWLLRIQLIHGEVIHTAGTLLPAAAAPCLHIHAACRHPAGARHLPAARNRGVVPAGSWGACAGHRELAEGALKATRGGLAQLIHGQEFRSETADVFLKECTLGSGVHRVVLFRREGGRRKEGGGVLWRKRVGGEVVEMCLPWERAWRMWRGLQTQCLQKHNTQEYTLSSIPNYFSLQTHN